MQYVVLNGKPVYYIQEQDDMNEPFHPTHDAV